MHLLKKEIIDKFMLRKQSFVQIFSDLHSLMEAKQNLKLTTYTIQL